MSETFQDYVSKGQIRRTNPVHYTKKLHNRYYMVDPYMTEELTFRLRGREVDLTKRGIQPNGLHRLFHVPQDILH